MRRRMCFRCGAHLPVGDFDESQRANHSPQCRKCIGWPVGMIPVRGMSYSEYVDFKTLGSLGEDNFPEITHTGATNIRLKGKENDLYNLR